MNTTPLSILQPTNIIDMHQYQLSQLLNFETNEYIIFYHSLDTFLRFNQTNFILFKDSLNFYLNSILKIL